MFDSVWSDSVVCSRNLQASDAGLWGNLPTQQKHRCNTDDHEASRIYHKLRNSGEGCEDDQRYKHVIRPKDIQLLVSDVTTPKSLGCFSST